MNGYVAKPLEPAALEHAIEEWTCGAPAPRDYAPASPPLPVSSEANAVFDSEDLVERLMGDEDLAQRIARRFVTDMPGQIALLAQAVNNLDSGAVRLVAHSIKGAAANVGVLRVRPS